MSSFQNDGALFTLNLSAQVFIRHGCGVFFFVLYKLAYNPNCKATYPLCHAYQLKRFNRIGHFFFFEYKKFNLPLKTSVRSSISCLSL